MKWITNLWSWGVKKFINRQFITFCIIGVFNTTINYLVLTLFYHLGLNDEILFEIVLATTIAFLVASTFSYFANNFVTFKNKEASANKFLQSLIVFAFRLVFTLLLTTLFAFIFNLLNLNGFWQGTFAPLLASAIMIPFAYGFLEKVLKVKEKHIIPENV